jgi:hypothetical protein
VLFLVLLASIVLWSILNGMPLINNLRAKWEAYRLQAQWEKPYREDTYGGKTPEETYDMFLAALSKGDTTLASKYFVIEKQDNWDKTLGEYKNNSLLASFTKELEDTRKIWKKSEKSTENLVSFTYINTVSKDKTVDFEGQKITIPSGNYINETMFEINTYTKIWKISVL